MRIQHNILAMNAYRNYNTNTSAVAKNLEKLSSGYKINRAGDDAAGLAISEKMRAQITGLNAAQKNVKDGISLVKTAEGAMQEIHDMLNRMDYLATQSANGTYDNEVDRANLQKEVQSLKDEINRIADSANFNGINLLDGSKAEKYTSALGAASAVLTDSMDGSAPSKAGAAEITVKLANNAATASTTLDPKTQKDGVTPAEATKAKIEFTMSADGTDAQDIAGTTIAAATPPAAGANAGDAYATGDTTFDMSNLAANDVIKVGGKTYTMVTTGNADATTGKFETVTQLKEYLKADGYALDDTTDTAAKITKLGTISDGTTTLTAGVSTVQDLMDLEYDTGKSLGDLFDVYIGTSTTAANGTDTLDAGAKITLVAKNAGALADEVGTLAGALADGDGNKVAKYTPGVDEDFPTGASAYTTYDLQIDLDQLRGGQYIEVGGKKITFTNDGTTNVTTGNAMSIDLNDTKANIATALQTALDSAFGVTNGSTTAFDSADKVASLDNDTNPTKLNYKITGVGNTDAILAATNLGEVRAFDANGAEETGKLLTKNDYVAAKKPDPAATGQSAFAQVTYELDTADLKEGNKLTIGGKVIEISATEDLANGKVKAADVDTKIAQALEQMGYTSGKVSVASTGGKTTITITGTEVGGTAADLAKGAGLVSFLDAASAPASKAEVSGGMSIEAGKTTVKNIKDSTMPDSKKLSDLFNVTVNGNTVADDYVIKEGDEVKFTAKVNGQFDKGVMDKFAFEGDVDSLTKKNGFDEGETATGDKTHYELAIDLAKVAGGNSFTFGNVNGKSITFDLSFDSVTTKNDTVGVDKNEEVPANNSSDRVTINLYGKNNADAQKEIFTQVKNAMEKAGFDVTRAISGSKMTLSLDAKEEGAQYNLGNIRTSSQSGALTNAVYNPAGGNAGGTKGTMAQVTYDFDLSQLQAGDSLTVGSTTIHFGDETKKETVDGATKFTVSVEEAKADPSKIVEALESAGYRSGQIRFDTDNNKVSITGIKTGETAAELQGAGGKISMSSTRKLNEGGLTLQIGDTADDFNQMTVSIGDMHTKGMGIENLDISTQAGAKDAIDVIKNAINYVSGIRGDLGATQNRLEHTANNLSIMAENIQDAESTIRDTDIAEEMMAYTKNNILVQSAQAMLAQANQVPQGVLQLLG